MDVLFYSRRNEESNNILFFLQSNRLLELMSFICIDKQVKNRDGSFSAEIFDGRLFPIPPNIHHIPSLFLATSKQVVNGNDNIQTYFSSLLAKQKAFEHQPESINKYTSNYTPNQNESVSCYDEKEKDNLNNFQDDLRKQYA